MITYGNLYSKIYTWENLKAAHKHASKDKHHYQEVKEVSRNVRYYFSKIKKSLTTHSYHTSQYTLFHKKEQNKDRTIYKLPYYPDRIVQWALMQVIEPYMKKRFTADTYSSIPKRGIHQGLKKVQEAMYGDPVNCQYCLKIDVKHFYQSINHTILKQQFRTLFKDKELLWLIDEIIDSIATADDEDVEFLETNLGVYIDQADTGIPIGNYISQYCGNFYLSDFDHWIKEVKHIKYYFRYMDDMVFFGATKEELQELLKEIKEYLKVNLKLALKPNYQVFPSYVRGVDFLGYRVFYRYTLIRKRTVKNMKPKVREMCKQIHAGFNLAPDQECCLDSYAGWFVHGNGHDLYNKYIKPLKPYCPSTYLEEEY